MIAPVSWPGLRLEPTHRCRWLRRNHQRWQFCRWPNLPYRRPFAPAMRCGAICHHRI